LHDAHFGQTHQHRSQAVTIIDFDQNDDALKPWIEQGMTFIKDRVTPENMGSLLGKHLSAGDLLIDLAWNIDCCEIVQWCHDRAFSM
jgi:homospermidine synthase